MFTAANMVAARLLQSALHFCERIGVRRRWIAERLMSSYVDTPTGSMSVQWFHFIKPSLFVGMPQSTRIHSFYPYTDHARKRQALAYFIQQRRHHPKQLTIVVHNPSNEPLKKNIEYKFQVAFINYPIAEVLCGNGVWYVVTPLSLSIIAADPITVLLMLRHGAMPTLEYLSAAQKYAKSQPLAMLAYCLNQRYLCKKRESRHDTNNVSRRHNDEHQVEQQTQQLVHAQTQPDAALNHQQQQQLQQDRILQQSHHHHPRYLDELPDVQPQIGIGAFCLPYDSNLDRRLQLCLRYISRAVPRLPVILTRDEAVLRPESLTALTNSDPVPLHVCCSTLLPPHYSTNSPPCLQHLCRCTVRRTLASVGRLPHGIGKLPVHHMLKSYLDLCFD